MKDYYRVLGILPSAEDVVIRAAYRALAQRYHPDKWKGKATDVETRMKEINEAYGVLSDTKKRGNSCADINLSRLTDFLVLIPFTGLSLT